MKYTISVTEAGGAREKLVLESRAGESVRHIVLKIVAYLLFAPTAPGPLRIEQAVGQRHRPDLVVTDPASGAVVLWIDCGQIETRRLGRIAASNPGALLYVVKSTSREASSYAESAVRFLPEGGERRDRIRFVGFRDGFTDDVVAAVRSRNEIVVRSVGDLFEVDWNGVRLVTGVTELRASVIFGAGETVSTPS
ncbi:MAG: YaeQ family protein [Capsulimonadales bacterium]|nr:YaeQ family protein [Capsulimonadales bacterium]